MRRGPSSARATAVVTRRLALPRTRPELVLGVLLAAGLLVRGLAMLAVWPVGLGINDSAPYTTAAAHNLLSDVQAPGGYPAVLWLLARISRQVAVTVVVQHALGVAAALVFFRAVRRASGSAWVALVPAAGLLLDSDQIYLEHSIMAEGVYAIVLALTLYTAVRALERPEALGWALAAGLLGRCRRVHPLGGDRARRGDRPGAALSARGGGRPGCAPGWPCSSAPWWCSAPYAVANRAQTPASSRSVPTPAGTCTGWSPTTPTADDFTPPPGTAALCQSTPVAQRPGLNFYLYDPRSPAQRTFGYFKHDARVGAFAKAVVRHQFGDYLRNVALNLAGYFVPAAYPHALGDPLGGQGLAHPLDWRRQNPDAAQLARIMRPSMPRSTSTTGPRLRTRWPSMRACSASERRCW